MKTVIVDASRMLNHPSQRRSHFSSFQEEGYARAYKA